MTYLWRNSLPVNGGPGWLHTITHAEIPHTSGEEEVVAHDFSLLTVANPISVADMKAWTGDPTLGDNTERQLVSVVSDPTYGKVVRFSLPPVWRGRRGALVAQPSGSTIVDYDPSYGTYDPEGIAWMPTLPQSFDDGFFEHYVRFNSNFQWSLGGKWLGIGGSRAGFSPPSGGTHTVNGFTMRDMWGVNGKVQPYWYRPQDTSTWGQGPSDASWIGGVLNLGNTGGFANGTVCKIRHRLKMNSVTTEGSTTPPNDGAHQIYWNDELRYQNLATTWRFYTDANIKRMMLSVFRGGSFDDDWNASNKLVSSIDVWGWRVVKYVG